MMICEEGRWRRQSGSVYETMLAEPLFCDLLERRSGIRGSSDEKGAYDSAQTV
jgi:hypothetical protein